MVKAQPRTESFTLKGGEEIPILGFGTWQILGQQAEEMVRKALDAGYRHIDCAEVYANQTFIGKAFKGYDRESLFITSKIDYGHHSKEQIFEATDRILKELQLEYLDLLLLHWPDRRVPFAESFAALHKVKAEGKARNLGVSNFTMHHLQDALDIGADICMNQVECHIYFYQKELHNFCTEHQILMTAYSPLGHGKMTQDPILKEIGAEYGKSAGQVALRWLVQMGIVVIPKTVHQERLYENADIFNFSLSPKEMTIIAELNKHERGNDPAISDFDY